jgi:hypothetical protein
LLHRKPNKQRNKEKKRLPHSSASVPDLMIRFGYLGQFGLIFYYLPIASFCSPAASHPPTHRDGRRRRGRVSDAHHKQLIKGQLITNKQKHMSFGGGDHSFFPV